MSRLLAPAKPPPLALALLILAAVAIMVAGFDHVRLWHRGYAEVDVVGPLFLLNGISTALVVLCLVFQRTTLFVLGAVGLCAGSLVSILISHNGSFFEFREGAYDGSAKLIVATEIAGLVFALAGVAAGGLRPAPADERVVAVAA